MDSPNWRDSRPDGVLIVCRCTCVRALAVAAAISLFNFQYGAALATVAGVLIEVLVIVLNYAAFLRHLVMLLAHCCPKQLLKQGLVRWDMLLTLGEAGDPEDNPTLLWPDNRRQVKVATLTISSAMAQKGAECENINFDPLVMGDGIAPTNDPILLFRSPAYAVSFAKRRGGL